MEVRWVWPVMSGLVDSVRWVERGLQCAGAVDSGDWGSVLLWPAVRGGVAGGKGGGGRYPGLATA